MTRRWLAVPLVLIIAACGGPTAPGGASHVPGAQTAAPAGGSPYAPSSVTQGDHPKPDVRVVTADLTAALARVPTTIDGAASEGDYLDLWWSCQAGAPEIANDPAASQEAWCEILVEHLWLVYQQTQDPTFYGLARAVYDYAQNALPDDLRAVLRQDFLAHPVPKAS